MHSEEEKQKVLKRLKKILALSESSNPGEAAAALHQANVLMEKYNLNTTDVEFAQVQEVEFGLTKAKPSMTDGLLVAAVAKSLGIAVYCKVGGKKAKFVFVGDSMKTEIAGYAYTVLLKQLKRDMEKSFDQIFFEMREAKSNPYLLLKPTLAQRKAYAVAWCCAVSDKVKALAPPLPPVVQLYMEQKEIKKAKPYRKLVIRDDVSSAMLAKGHRDGQLAQLNAGVNGQANASVFLN